MSEYTSITDGLRGSMKRVQVFGSPFVQKEAIYFDQMCDAIDSVHAALEADNERLRGEWDFWESTHVELPKDMDGEPIRIGDVMEWSDGKTFVVVGIGDGTLYYLDADKDGHVSIEWTSTEQKRHHKPDTWERIIEDAVNVHGNGFNPCWTDERNALVARCKALAGDAE